MPSYHIAVGYTHQGMRLTATFMPEATSREAALAKGLALFRRTHTHQAVVRTIRCLWRTDDPDIRAKLRQIPGQRDRRLR